MSILSTIGLIEKAAKLISILVKSVRSLDEAIRKANDLPEPEPLPEDWDSLVEEGKPEQ